MQPLKASGMCQMGSALSSMLVRGPQSKAMLGMQVVRAALQDAGAAGAQLAAVQLHGTGTPLGDPIEMGAISAVASGGFCPMSDHRMNHRAHRLRQMSDQLAPAPAMCACLAARVL